MMQKLKFVSLLLAGAMMLSLAACGGASSSSSSQAASSQAAAAEENYYAYDVTEGLILRKLVGAFQTAEENGAFIQFGGRIFDEEKQIGLGWLNCYPADVSETNIRSCTYATFVYAANPNVTEEEIAEAYNALGDENTPAEELWENRKMKKITTQNGYPVYLDTADQENAYYGDLSEEDKALFDSMWSDLDAQLAEIEVTEPHELESSGDTTFKTTDYDGNEVDNSIFANAKLTMVNIWGTFCGPCVSEMPELQELNDELDGVQVVTILCDADGLQDKLTIEEAHDIMASQGVTLPVLLLNDTLEAAFPFNATPTSYLVDSNGNIVGKAMVGNSGKDSYVKWIQEGLDSLN